MEQIVTYSRKKITNLDVTHAKPTVVITTTTGIGAADWETKEVYDMLSTIAESGAGDEALTHG